MAKTEKNEVNGMSAVLSCLEKGENVPALSAVKAVLEADPGNVPARLKLAEIYYILEDPSSAVKEIETMLIQQNNSAPAQMVSGDILSGLGRYDEALAQYDKALEIAQGSAGMISGIFNKRADMFCCQGKYDEALRDIKKSVEIDGKNSHAYRTWGVICKQQGDYAQALRMLGEALEYSDNDKKYEAGIYNDKAEIYLKLGEHEQYLNELRNMPQKDVWVHLTLGDTYTSKELYKEALEEYDAALKADNIDAVLKESLHEKKAHIYNRTENYYLLAEEINELSRLDPLKVSTQLALGRVYRQSGDEKRAQETLEKVLKLTAGESSVRLSDPGVSGMESLRTENRLLNEREFKEEKIKLSSRPLYLTVHLTERCNLNCKMCSAPKSSNKVISGKVKAEVLKALPYLEAVSWMGGEVFLYPDFDQLLDEAIKYGVRQKITTNTLLMSEAHAEKFVANNVNLNVSVDAVTKELYEYIRRGAKYETMIEKLKMLRRMKNKINPSFKLYLKVVVMRSNP